MLRRWIDKRFALAFMMAVVAVPSDACADCVWSDVAVNEPRVAVVRSETPRTQFVQIDALVHGCPSEKPECQQRAFLVAGDVVLIGPTQGAYTCSGFLGRRGPSTIAWLPTAALAPLTNDQQSPTDWAGHWVAPEQTITIANGSSGALIVTGDATWGDTPDRRRLGSVHTGELAGTMRADKGVLAFAMGDENHTLPFGAGDEFTCSARMVQRGPYLVVRDNKACGGANVSFSGFYRRDQ
ncbi:hypothetical protein [Lichenihabitans psoromatis]|uniref:hypothetical protein n=1 Tax=Lichenihabitans psoromatis TaxID=2528642 RepID=UPI0010385DED|nr:hypothetical protein [Lichenihabitans psoromatis]